MSSVPIEEAAMSGHRSLRSVPVPILSLFFGLFWGGRRVLSLSRFPHCLSRCPQWVLASDRPDYRTVSIGVRTD